MLCACVLTWSAPRQCCVLMWRTGRQCCVLMAEGPPGEYRVAEVAHRSM